MEQLDNIREQLHHDRFTNEHTYLNESARLEEEDEDWREERIQQLDKIISKGAKEANLQSKKNFEHEISKSNFDKALDEVSKYAMQKPWFQLPEFFKVQKIKEYLENTIECKEDRDKMMKEITLLVYDKELRTKKHVDYDKEEAEVANIPALQYDPETHEYSITT